MKRMKEMWDKIHPELDITAKNVRERAMRIINKKLIRETGLILEQQETIQELLEGENRASNTDAPEKNSETIQKIWRKDMSLIVGFWNKNCYSLHSTTFNLSAEISKGNLELPQMASENKNDPYIKRRKHQRP